MFSTGALPVSVDQWLARVSIFLILFSGGLEFATSFSFFCCGCVFFYWYVFVSYFLVDLSSVFLSFFFAVPCSSTGNILFLFVCLHAGHVREP